MSKFFKKWISTAFRSASLAKEKIFWVIEESEVYQCCTAIKFYNQRDELLYSEEMKGLDFKTLSENQIKELNRKAQKILLQIYE